MTDDKTKAVYVVDSEISNLTKLPVGQKIEVVLPTLDDRKEGSKAIEEYHIQIKVKLAQEISSLSGIEEDIIYDHISNNDNEEIYHIKNLKVFNSTQ